MNVRGDEVGSAALLLKGAELVFILIISLTMAKVPGKFYWAPDVLAAILSICLMPIYCMVSSNGSDLKKLDRLICALFVDLIISICLLIQILFLSMRNLYATSAAGKIIAQIISIGFVYCWCKLSSAGHKAWYT